MILLDTNVLSELVRPEPHPTVLAWVAGQRRADLCTSVVSEAELAYGIALLPKGRRRDALEQAIARLLGEGLGGRVLSIDRAAAPAYARFVADRRNRGKPVSTADAMIAAVARSRGMTTLATRNVADFQGCGVKTVDPWSGG